MALHIADSTVADCADTAERAMDVTIHFAPKRTYDRRLVEVLHDDDFRSGLGCDIPPVLAPRLGVVPGVLPIAWLENHGDGISHHWAHLRHEVPGLLQVERFGGGITCGDLLPTVVDRRSVPALQFQQRAVGQDGLRHASRCTVGSIIEP